MEYRTWKLRTGVLIAILLLSVGAFLLTQNGCADNGPPLRTSSIQHVVIIFQENRTPDNLFQDPVLIARGADIASNGMNSQGRRIKLGQIDLGTNGSHANHYDLSHAHSAFVVQCNRNPGTGVCAMDGSDLVPIACSAGFACPPANPQFMYVNPADVQPYFQMAEQYTFADRMFQTNQGPSFPAHQYIISGTSAPSPTSPLFAAENPFANLAGCAAPPNTTVAMIDPTGQETSLQYPCFEHATLTDLLNDAGVSWRYYSAAGSGSIWTAPNAIEHMCGPNAPPPNATACVGPDWVNNVVLSTRENPAPVLSDIANGKLASVSWVIPNGLDSDHAQGNDGSGPSWVAAIVNAIGNSEYWSNTAIIIAWDDWGGWYDHVPPPQMRNSYEYGFRVPMMVVSPYAKAAYISHVTHDFGSILKFVEETFGLRSLGYADSWADDLSDCFNFSQQPIQFHTIAAPLNAAHFLNDRRPPTDPDDD
jgi:phospholipase C